MDMHLISEQEKSVRVPSFTNEDAWTLGNIIVDLARKNEYAISVSIERSDQILFQYAFEGTSPDNDRWMTGKRNVVKHFHKSSLFMKEKLLTYGKPMEEAMFLDSNIYLAKGGGLPIYVEGVGVVGSLIISGLKDEEDHALALAGLHEFLKSK